MTMAPKKKLPTPASADIGDKYKKLNHREHVLSRPGMYIGSIEQDAYTTWVVGNPDATDADGALRMERREVRFVPGLYKIFDEILVNAVDHMVRLRMLGDKEDAVVQTKNIRVDIDRMTGLISVTNDGNGIEVEKHPEHGIYIPELIFGHLLTSTNYDDAENPDRIVGGQNGIGAKACNVFSKHFTVETVDAHRKKIYTQTFRDNMSEIELPTIKACAKKPYTKITFLPDYARFGMPDGKLTDDMYALMVKRVVDMCAVTPSDVSVHLNGRKLDHKSFEKVVELYLPPGMPASERVYEKVNDRFELVVSYHDGEAFTGPEHVSFVNGIWTFRGGKHVESVVQNVSTKLAELIAKKKKEAGADIKPMHVKNFLFVFVKSTIPNPTFDSQTKDTLTTPVSKFGYKLELSDKFYDKLYKSGLTEKALTLSQAGASKTAKKTDGKKHVSLRGIPKLDDANWAGTAKSQECTLILTEGDSAKSMAIAGLAEVGRDRYGVFPLRGKLMNVKDVAAKKIWENEEIANLKKIMGLETGKVYQDTKDLRYGRILVMCDADVDGSHIKGLLFNLFHALWPSLLKQLGFITSMLTPIVKARVKGAASNTASGSSSTGKPKKTALAAVKGAADSSEQSFYSLTDYETWRKAQQEAIQKGSWEIKYYKGLGTSTSEEARGYFKQLRMVYYDWEEDPSSEDALDLAFNKKRADDRKGWLERYDRHAILDYADPHVSYDRFVHRDLIHFSNYDLERSIPSMCDGLKVSQRKVLYGCFKRNLVKQEIRVAQLAAYVSEHSAYHHGEASLQGTIIALAQDFVGSNNINLLRPNGQFGTRIQGGKDAASPRYIHTLLNPVTHAVFHRDDSEVLDYNVDDDDLPVEPLYYVGTIPLVLVNGALGIGTGFSTTVPCYNPRDIVRAIRMLLEDPTRIDLPELTPWYRGFKGRIERIGSENGKSSKYVSHGTYVRTAPGSCQIRITELPVGTWTEDYKGFLEDLLEKGNAYGFKSYESNYTDTEVDFKLIFQTRAAVDALLADPGKFEEAFKLVSPKGLGTSNMVLFNADHQIRKYDTVEDILRAFYAVRLETYQKRKDHLLAKLMAELTILQAKVAFIQAVVDGRLAIMNRPRADIEADLQNKLALPKHAQEGSYDYLLRMAVSSLTRERKRELEEEEAKKRAQHAEIQATSLEQMWRADLDALEAAL